jgi:hypothetical protein
VGAQLVGRVLDHWQHLPDVQYRVLLRMAHTALDWPRRDQPAATYWGGHELLARTLRRDWPAATDPRSRQQRDVILRDVRRACVELVKDGAIEIIDTGRTVRSGHAQVYRLTL